MVVAVTAGDRYGKGQSPLLVTRPLLARAALPRFLRPGDRFSAGAVINHRLGGTPTVRVAARASGVRLTGESSKNVTLEAGRGRETRFDFTALPGDSATFRFDVAGARDSDAVQLKIPLRPPAREGALTAAGILRDTATASFTLPGNLDLARSKITLSLGASPVALLRSTARARPPVPKPATPSLWRRRSAKASPSCSAASDPTAASVSGAPRTGLHPG
jgi:uncharacterized protein YfaS (alpha-2-macroglobulin family)